MCVCHCVHVSLCACGVYAYVHACGVCVSCVCRGVMQCAIPALFYSLCIGGKATAYSRCGCACEC